MTKEHESTSVRWDRAKTVSLWMVILLLATSFGAYMGMAANPNLNTIFQPGSAVSPPTYTIFTDGSGYFTRDGRTGAVSSGTAASLIQTAARFVKGFNSGGSALIKAGNYYLGTSNVSVSAADGNCCAAEGWSIDFEPGAQVFYNGTGFAFFFSSQPAAYGALTRWAIHNPAITTSTGSCIQMFRVAQVTITNPLLRCKTVGIDIDYANTITVSGTGYIIENGNTRGAGTTGIRLGYTRTGQTNLITVSGGVYVAAFESGIYAGDTQQINILSGDIEANKYGVNLVGSHNVNIQATWFESNTAAEVFVSGGSTTTTETNLYGNFFSGGAPYALQVPNGNITYYLTAFANNWGSEPIYLGDAMSWATVEINTAGTVTNNSPGKITLTFNPNPQSSSVSLSTASTGLKTTAVTFPVAYPGGITPKVFLSLENPTDSAARFNGTWASSMSNTGFTVNLAVETAGAGGSTVTVVWMATP